MRTKYLRIFITQREGGVEGEELKATYYLDLTFLTG